jgi:hypothetical protein
VLLSAFELPILGPVETPDLFDFDDPELDDPAPARPAPDRPPTPYVRPGGGIWSLGGRIGWIAGLILMLSSFMSWYSGAAVEGPTLSVIGWHAGTIGKLVFFLGALIVVMAILGEAGIELPPSLPESLVTIGLGALSTVLVLIRVISIPDTFAGTSGRAIGLWIALLSALAVIAAGLLKAGEDL